MSALEHRQLRVGHQPGDLLAVGHGRDVVESPARDVGRARHPIQAAEHVCRAVGRRVRDRSEWAAAHPPV
ncbi:MAG: hypothetical protein ACK4V6_14445, partial [Microthrixaceae bacterium]